MKRLVVVAALLAAFAAEAATVPRGGPQWLELAWRLRSGSSGHERQRQRSEAFGPQAGHGSP